MLLADAVLVRLPVSARAGADPGLEAAAAQNLSTGRGGGGHGDSVRHKVSEQRRWGERSGVSYSLVSKVTMMRMGRRFIPPTQLELHMKLYKIVVNSVPT